MKPKFIYRIISQGIGFTRNYFIDNKSDDPNQTSSQQSNTYEAVINLGYYYTFVIGKRFYISLAQSTRNDHETTVQQNATRTYFQVFTGYRFIAPRFIKKSTILIEEKIPIKNLHK